MYRNILICHIFLLSILAGGLFCIATMQAQTPFEEAMQQLNSTNVHGYLQPFVNGVGADMNAGFYHSADISSLGLFFQFELVTMGTLIGDDEKYYMATPPVSQGYTQQPVRTATVFGDKGTIIQGPAPGLEYQFQNGQFKTPILPGVVPQVTIGNIFGTQAVVRYIQIPQIGDIPRTTLAGGGLRHNISRYLPVLPLDVAAGIFYQKFTFGDYITATATSFGLQASKSFSIATLYGGLQYESATMSLNYLFKGQPPTKISLDLDAVNHARMTAGLNLNLVILNLNGDISVGNVTVVTAGVSFGM